MLDPHKKAKNMADKVRNKINEGSLEEAKKAFTRAWKDVVPDIPQRISFILIRVEDKTIDKIMKKLRQDNKTPDLKILGDFETGLSVNLSRGKKNRLGDLNYKDTNILKNFEGSLKLYKPELLEIRRSEDGDVDFVAIELVRPDKKICSSCGDVFYSDHVNCDKCRKSRRKKGAEHIEHAPIAFHEAVDQIIISEEYELDDLDEDIPK